MDNIHFFEILHIFVSKHVDVTLEELLNIEEALHYYKRLNAKTLDDITRAMSTDHKQVAKIAGELEIFRYKHHTLQKQRSLIIEKFNAVFSKCDSCDEDIKPINETKQEEKDEQKEEEKEEKNKEPETKRKRKENPEGYVYVFSNPTHAHYGENVYKIGYSGDPNEREHDFDTANPKPSNVLYTYRHKKARQLEQRVHDSLDMFRLYQNREFFRCALPVIKEMINFLGTTM